MENLLKLTIDSLVTSLSVESSLSTFKTPSYPIMTGAIERFLQQISISEIDESHAQLKRVRRVSSQGYERIQLRCSRRSIGSVAHCSHKEHGKWSSDRRIDSLRGKAPNFSFFRWISTRRASLCRERRAS